MQKFYRHVELGSLIALPSALSASTKTDNDGRVAARQAKSSGRPVSELTFAVKGAENEIAYVEDLIEEQQLEKMRKAYRQKDAEALLDRRISLRCIV